MRFLNFRRELALLICPELGAGMAAYGFPYRRFNRDGTPYNGEVKPLARQRADALRAAQDAPVLPLADVLAARKRWLEDERSAALQTVSGVAADGVGNTDTIALVVPAGPFMRLLCAVYFRESLPGFAQSYRLASLQAGAHGIIVAARDEAFALIKIEASARDWPVVPQLSDAEES